MSRKWLEKEGASWVDEGLITDSQFGQILARYPEKAKITKILPTLAGLLVALGILSFIASNWGAIPNPAKLLIISAVLSLFYFLGNRAIERNSYNLGVSLIALGVASFGAGIILTGQMFHLVSYDARLFIFWGIVSLLFTFIYRSRLLYLVTLVILSFGQFYSFSEFREYSYILLIITILGCGTYLWQWKSEALSWVFVPFTLFQTSMLFVLYEVSWGWAFLVAILFYTVGDALDRRVFHSFQTVPLIIGFLLSLLLTFFDEPWMFEELFEDQIYFLILTVLLLTSSLFLKWIKQRLESGFEWVLFFPYYELVDEKVGAIYILVLFLFSTYILRRGFVEQWRLKINLGTFLFLLSTFVAYTNLAWDFMPKSVLFLIGGILLYAINYVLQRKKKELFIDGGGANRE